MNLQTCPDTPQALVERIERHVQSRTGGMIRSLHVEVVGEDVFVSGRTSTYYNKQLATHAVLAAVQGMNLTNDIEVC